jgi:hypothetical protein
MVPDLIWDNQVEPTSFVFAFSVDNESSLYSSNCSLSTLSQLQWHRENGPSRRNTYGQMFRGRDCRMKVDETRKQQQKNSPSWVFSNPPPTLDCYSGGMLFSVLFSRSGLVSPLFSNVSSMPSTRSIRGTLRRGLCLFSIWSLR